MSTLVFPSLEVIVALVAPTAFNLKLNEPSVKLDGVVEEAIEESINAMFNFVSSALAGLIVVFTFTESPTLPETLVGSNVIDSTFSTVFMLFLLSQMQMDQQPPHPCML